MPNVSFTYYLEIAKCFWWGPFLDPVDRSLQTAEGYLAQRLIELIMF